MPPKIVEKPAPDSKSAEAAKASAARHRELDAAISTITKAYGEGSIMRLGDARAQTKIDVIPTGALALDLALGVGGVPRGRVVEIFGPESIFLPERREGAAKRGRPKAPSSRLRSRGWKSARSWHGRGSRS